MKRQGFSLIELISVIVIIALLVALLFPVIVSARKRGIQADKVERLRQIAIAMEIYQGDHGEFPVTRHLEPLVHAKLLPANLLMFPGDPFKDGYGYTFSHCMEKVNLPTIRTSVEDPFVQEGFLRKLIATDENFGIAADRTGGHQNPREANCATISMEFTGTLLRLRRDGSVQTTQFKLTETADGQLGFERYRLFTDRPIKTGS